MPTTSSTPRGAPHIRSLKQFSKKLDRLTFRKPVAYVYNPLDYAWAAHKLFLESYGTPRKKILFLGMNPGPFGMAQTGVPFGEVSWVRDWLKITATIKKPKLEHPKRPILGFECHRSEVSGDRVWSFIKEEFGRPKTFFKNHYIINYCPLVFMEESGRNITPDRLEKKDREALFALCDEYLVETVKLYRPAWILGIGQFAYKKAVLATEGTEIQTGCLLHPSPASPLANKNWAGTVKSQLRDLGILP